MTPGRLGPLAASLAVTLAITLMPAEYGIPVGLLVQNGLLAWAAVSLIDDLAARLELGWLAICLSLTALIAGLSVLEYSACLGGWLGAAAELAFVSTEDAVLLTAMQVITRCYCDAIRHWFWLEDDWPYDHDDEEWGEDGDG